MKEFEKVLSATWQEGFSWVIQNLFPAVSHVGSFKL
jgi:hypothetical protein